MHLKTIMGKVCLLSFLATAALQAGTITLPNLAPGSKYRLIFVTSGTTAATSTDISTYNTFATNQANANATLASLSASWVVVGGTATTTALTNVGTSTAPIYLVNGTLVGSSMTSICTDGQLNSGVKVNLNQNGDTFNGQVWTGTSNTCGAQSRPLGGHTTNNEVRYGDTNQTNSNWLSFGNASETTSRPVYALSSEITVGGAVPEPAALALTGLGLALLACLRRQPR